MAYNDLYQYPYQFDQYGRPIAPPSTNPVTPVTSPTNPQDAAREDRAYAYTAGQQLGYGLQDDQANARNALTNYTNAANTAYDPLLAGGGGYTPDQFGNILQQNTLNTLPQTQDEYNRSYLSGDEWNAINSDVNNRRKYFDPGFETQLFGEGAQNVRGAVGQYQQGLNQSFNPATLRPGADYGQNLQSGVDAYGNTANRNLDVYGQTSNQNLDQFGNQTNVNLNQFQQATNANLNPAQLNVSNQFLQDYRMSPQEQQAIRQASANVIGTRDKAAIGELERRARAEGTNPLGVAAYRARAERGMNANAADAATAAGVQASHEAAGRLSTGEQMRLQAAQSLAGQQQRAAEYLTGQRQGATQYATGARQDAAGFLAGQRNAAAGNVLDANYRALTTGENARSAAERDIADRQMQAAQAGGQANLLNEQDIARARLMLQQGQTQVGNEAERDVDTTASARAMALAQNRQQAEQANQAQRYGRGMAISNTLADRYKYGADATRQDSAEARGYLTGQVAQSNANNNYLTGQRTNLYGQQTGAMQRATGTQGQLYAQQQAQPKWYDKVIGAVVGGAGAALGGGTGAVSKGIGGAVKGFGGGRATGGVITEPTVAILGEQGPEVVVPLNGEGSTVLPSLAMQQQQPPVPARRPKAAYSQQYRYAA